MLPTPEISEKIITNTLLQIKDLVSRFGCCSYNLITPADIVKSFCQKYCSVGEPFCARGETIYHKTAIIHSLKITLKLFH